MLHRSEQAPIVGADVSQSAPGGAGPPATGRTIKRQQRRSLVVSCGISDRHIMQTPIRPTLRVPGWRVLRLMFGTLGPRRGRRFLSLIQQLFIRSTLNTAIRRRSTTCNQGKSRHRWGKYRICTLHIPPPPAWRYQCQSTQSTVAIKCAIYGTCDPGLFLQRQRGRQQSISREKIYVYTLSHQRPGQTTPRYVLVLCKPPSIS